MTESEMIADLQERVKYLENFLQNATVNIARQRQGLPPIMPDEAQPTTDQETDQ